MKNPEHLAKLNEGVEAWNKWRDENPEIVPDLDHARLRMADLANANLNGVHLEHADLPWAHLEHASLRDAHLEHAYLQGAHLNYAILWGTRLDHAILREAHLEHADLLDAHLEHANLEGAHLADTILARAHLGGTKLTGANLANADVTRLSYLGPAPLPEKRTPFRVSVAARRLWDWLRNNPMPYRHRVMRNRYQGIRGLDSCHGNRIFVREASDQDYLDTIESQLRGRRWRKFCFWLWGLTDYGRSIMSVVGFATLLICVFGWAYSYWPQMISARPRTPTAFTPYYFSIVTYTTLGFGDVKPINLGGEILVSMEVILGYVTLGLLLAVLGDRIARRS